MEDHLLLLMLGYSTLVFLLLCTTVKTELLLTVVCRMCVYLGSVYLKMIMHIYAVNVCNIMMHEWDFNKLLNYLAMYTFGANTLFVISVGLT